MSDALPSKPLPAVPAPTELRPVVIAGDMRRAIDEALTMIPEGRNGCVLTLFSEEGVKAKVAAVIDRDRQWQVFGEVDKPWQAGLRWRVGASYVW